MLGRHERIALALAGVHVTGEKKKKKKKRFFIDKGIRQSSPTLGISNNVQVG